MQMLVDPRSDFCYVSVKDKSPIKIMKIDLRNNEVLKTVETADLCKLDGNYVA